MRIKLIVLITTLFLSFQSFSQNDTGNKVVLSETVARKVAKDLIRLDKADSINAVLENQLEIETQKVTLKDGIIANQDSIISNQKEQMLNCSSIIENVNSERDLWKKEAKKSKRRLMFVGIGSATLIILLLL